MQIYNAKNGDIGLLSEVSIPLCQCGILHIPLHFSQIYKALFSFLFVFLASPTLTMQAFTHHAQGGLDAPACCWHVHVGTIVIINFNSKKRHFKA